jgi:septum formation topological specificity factor MinE
VLSSEIVGTSLAGNAGGKPDLIPILREDILAAIRKHVTVDSDKVRVRVERGDVVSLLEIDIEIPAPVKYTSGMRTTAVHLG